MTATLCPHCGNDNQATGQSCVACAKSAAPSFVAVARGEWPRPILPGADRWRSAGAAAVVSPAFEVALDDGAGDGFDEVSAADFDLVEDAPVGPAEPVVAPGVSPAPELPAEPVEDAVAPTISPIAALPPVCRARLVPLWRRGVSGVVDLVPPTAVGTLLLLVFQGRLDAVGLPLLPRTLDELGRWWWAMGTGIYWIAAGLALVVLAYHAVCLAYMQGTVGDVLVGVRWITRRGWRPSRLRAGWRALLLVMSWALGFAGVLTALLSRTRRPLYDVASGLYPVLTSSCELCAVPASSPDSDSQEDQHDQERAPGAPSPSAPPLASSET